jgi:hypothetical protein
MNKSPLNDDQLKALGEVDNWLRKKYDDEIQNIKMIRIALVERMQLYALAIHLMQQMKITEIKLNLDDFHATNKYLLGMGQEEDNRNECAFRLTENPYPEPEWKKE